MDNVNKVEGPQCSYKLYFKDIDKIVSQSGRVSSHHSDINQNSNGVWIFFSAINRPKLPGIKVRLDFSGHKNLLLYL